MGAEAIVALVALAVGVLGSVLLTVFKTGAVKQVVDDMAREVEGNKTLNERVLTLEHNHQSLVDTRAQLKLQNDREHESIRQEQRAIRDNHHQLANVVNNINVNLELIKDFVTDLKAERRQRERD